MTVGIVKDSIHTGIPPIPDMTPGSQGTDTINSQQSSSHTQGDTTGGTFQELLQKLQQLETDIGIERGCYGALEWDFQSKWETLIDTIAALEARLSGSDPSNSAYKMKLLIARINVESVAAAMSAAMAAFSGSPALNKNMKKYALLSANYVSAEAVEHSSIIPEIVLRTACKGFFIPFADLTAAQYCDYTLNDRTIKKVM